MTEEMIDVRELVALLVGDDHPSLQFLIELLPSQDIKIFTASNIKDYQDIYLKCRPDLVISDISMSETQH